MMFKNSKLFPLFSILTTLTIFVFGFVNAEHFEMLYFFIALWVFFFISGFWKSCLMILPFTAVMLVFFSGLTYLISKNFVFTYSAVNRVLTACFSVIPSLSLSPVRLIRNLSQLKFPRVLTFGMMIAFSFFPLLLEEARHIRSAMKTRGVHRILNFRILHRAFLIPFVVRLVNISDILALSVETRGFTFEKNSFSIYKPIKITVFDIAFVVIFVALVVLTGIFI